jgi:hypothetical protein
VTPFHGARQRAHANFTIILQIEFKHNTTDVKRVYAMRAALQLLDFDDESAATFKHLCLRAAIHPLCKLTTTNLRSSESLNFVSFLFSLHSALCARKSHD